MRAKFCIGGMARPTSVALFFLLAQLMVGAMGEPSEPLPAPPPPKPATPATPPPPSDASFFVAVMLLGSVAFVMGLFYLLHFPDDDIRTYSWNVVSASICTFTGVLIGMSWNQCFVYFVVGPPQTAGAVKTILCNFGSCVGWYILLQLALAVVSGAIGATPKDPVTTVLNLKCFAVLLGITNGASNLTLWGLVQSKCPDTFAGTAGVLLACFFTMGFMFKVGDIVRARVSKGDDGTEDEYERLWDKFAEETEDGALCMTLAHLLVQITRLEITGKLPLPGGQMPPGLQPTVHDTHLLLLCGLGYACLIPIIDLCFELKNMARFKGWLKKIAGNATAFCLLYSITWAVGDSIDVKNPPGQMVLALAVSAAGISIIIVLDKIADMKCTGEAVDREVKAFVGPVALLIGFGWKQAFVGSLTTITARVKYFPPPIQTLGMAFALVLVVVPAWRLYILPTVMNEMVKQEEKKMSKGKSNTLVKPLLNDQVQNGASAGSISTAPAGDVAKDNIMLRRRNADLEASIRDIQKELGELKQLAALLS